MSRGDQMLMAVWGEMEVEKRSSLCVRKRERSKQCRTERWPSRVMNRVTRRARGGMGEEVRERGGGGGIYMAVGIGRRGIGSQT